MRSGNLPSKISLSKNLVTPRESEKELSAMKNKKFDSTLKNNTPHKKVVDKSKSGKLSTPTSKTNATFLREIHSKNKPVSVIHVPLDEKYKKDETPRSDSQKTLVLPDIADMTGKIDSITGIENGLCLKHVTSIGTDAVPDTVDKITQSDDLHEELCGSIENANLQDEIRRETYDSLYIPNVTLTKDKNESKEKTVSFHSKSLPNLQVPSLKVTPNKSVSNKEDSDFYKKSSYIIGHATVTCTTKQKINFHVVGSNNETSSNQSPSPLAYPMNVVSIYEKEIKKKQIPDTYKQDKSKGEYTNCPNELKSLNCNKLVKPSDIISTIRVNNGLLQSDYICEQFERELNFIDSFFESLQYLESCSLSEKCFSGNKVKSWINNCDFDVRNSEYGCFLSKLENGANVDDTETMASKSLCLVSAILYICKHLASNNYSYAL